MEDSNDTMNDHLKGRFELGLTSSLDDETLAMQRGDGELRQLTEILERPEDLCTKKEESRANDFVLKHGKLVHIIDLNKHRSGKFVLPKAMLRAVVMQCHALLGHYLVDRAVAKLQGTFWFLCMRNYVRKHIF